MHLLILKLLLAHFIGDFVFQPKKWVVHKEEYKHKSVYLKLHVVVHLLLLFVVLGCSVKYLGAILCIVVSHYFIDVLKLTFTTKKNAIRWFFIDQFLHLVVIAIVVYAFYPYYIDWEFVFAQKHLLFVLALIFVTHVSSVLLKVVLSKWKIASDKSEKSLPNAGNYIGIIERLFVFVFIINGQWQAIGFLIASKSILRFNDLSKAKDRKLTEYVLIGTLASFGLAALGGVVYLYLLPFLE